MTKKEKLWSARIDEWKRSGLSQRRYCEERQVSLSTFQWWRTRLRAPEHETPEHSALVELSVPGRGTGGSDEHAPAIRIAVGTYSVSVPIGFSAPELARVLNVLDGR